MYKVSVSLVVEAQIQSPFVSGGGTYYKTFILFLIKTHELKFFLTTYYSDKNTKSKSQLLSKEHFFSILPKKRTENFCPSKLGLKIEVSSSFFGRIEDTKNTFQN